MHPITTTTALSNGDPAAKAGKRSGSTLNMPSKRKRDSLLDLSMPSKRKTQDKVLPECIGKHMENTFELMGHRHVILRDNTLKIISLIKDWETIKTTETKGFVIDGERGSGKSFALQQIVQFVRESDWLVLYVPNARARCVGAPHLKRSPMDESKFDMVVFGVELLGKFLHCHGAQLGEIPLHGCYGDRYYSASFKAMPKSKSEYDAVALMLRDLVENGIKDEELACTAVVDLRTELALATEFPVLIAVDEYNHWFQETIFNFEGRKIFPSDITVIDALKDIGADGLEPSRTLANGLFVAAVMEKYPSHYEFKKQVNYRSLRTTMRTLTQEELESVAAYNNRKRGSPPDVSTFSNRADSTLLVLRRLAPASDGTSLRLGGEESRSPTATVSMTRETKVIRSHEVNNGIVLAAIALLRSHLDDLMTVGVDLALIALVLKSKVGTITQIRTRAKRGRGKAGRFNESPEVAAMRKERRGQLKTLHGNLMNAYKTQESKQTILKVMVFPSTKVYRSEEHVRCMLDFIKNSKYSLNVAVYVLTHSRLATAIKAKAKHADV